MAIRRHIIGAGYMKGSIHFDKKTDRWYISIYFEGQRYKFFRHPITHEPLWDQRTAKKLLGKIQTEIDEGYFNPRTWQPNNHMSTEAYALEWLEAVRDSISPNTYKDYRSSVRLYIIPFFQDKDLRYIRHNDLVRFRNSINRCDKGKYNVVGCLKTIMNYAWRNEDIAKVPPFPKLGYDLPEIKYLDMEQQNQILDAIPAPDRPIFKFMMEYGVRPGEARALQKDCIHNGNVIIRRAFSDNTLMETTKTKLTRTYEITEYFAEILENMPKNLSPFVFVRQKDAKPYTSKNLNKIWHKACDTVGIRIKLYNGVRHSLGCQLLDLGYDMDLVRDQLGHTKSEMTRRYAKRSKKKLTEALEARRGKVIRIRKEK